MDAELERSLAGLRRERTSKSGPNDEYEDN
jgi:hypothetical protein